MWLEQLDLDLAVLIVLWLARRDVCEARPDGGDGVWRICSGRF